MKLDRLFRRVRPTLREPKLHSKLRQHAQDRVRRRMERAAREDDWDDAGLVEVEGEGFCSFPFCSQSCCD